jgi:ssDNA-binding Zn-finger/Zn-ribbon topoisomerase 1
MKKLTTEEFIDRAIAVHGDKYGYAEVVYENSETKVTIICEEHGKFSQAPKAHIRGQRCPACSKVKKHSFYSFKAKAENVHGNKYIYTETAIKRIHDKIIIVCPDHGEFLQSAHHHIRGSGCPKCSQLKVANSHTLSTSDFIEKAICLHGDKYDYSESHYTFSKELIAIKCPSHGIFLQLANSHLNGRGCPKCATVISKGHAEVAAFLESILNG